MTTRSTTAESKFAGVWLPQRICAYLSLYALGTEVSKSKIMRAAIEKWYEHNQKAWPIQNLILTLAENAQVDWNIMKAKRRHEWGGKIDTAFDFYKQELTRKLERKGINQEHIKQILEQLSNEEN